MFLQRFRAGQVATVSCQISEVKQQALGLVLGWVTALEDPRTSAAQLVVKGRVLSGTVCGSLQLKDPWESRKEQGQDPVSQASVSALAK